MGTVYLSDLICPRPTYLKSQEESFSWLRQAYFKYQKNQDYSEESYERLLKRVGVNPKQIASRGHFLSDFDLNSEEKKVFLNDQFLGMSTRQKEYQKIVEKVFSDIFEKRNLPRHLIHVSCTGYVSPSAAQVLASEKSPETVVTHCYHMGCYAAFPALRMAQGFVHSMLAQNSENLSGEVGVDIVHTELCTLHLNPQDPSLEQILVQTLFADGVAAYRISPFKPKTGFELLHLGEFLLPNSKDAMSWDLSETGFVMSLSKDVPKLIADHLRLALEKWEKQIQIPLRALLKDCIVAVHPGGPKIIDYVQKTLELSEAQVRYSRKVLRECGNMSSATVAHIWEEILKDEAVISGKPVISMAFGPGLTVSMSLMKVVK